MKRNERNICYDELNTESVSIYLDQTKYVYLCIICVVTESLTEFEIYLYYLVMIILYANQICLIN